MSGMKSSFNTLERTSGGVLARTRAGRKTSLEIFPRSFRAAKSDNVDGTYVSAGTSRRGFSFSTT
eukprot:scaffold19665_cov14-Tisochrysis_lutea.AAC.1